jgi:hypothetical protein
MATMPNHARSKLALANLFRTISAFLVSVLLIAATALPRSAHGGEIPTFAVDAAWPKPLPNNWIIGEVGGITADSKGHIWGLPSPALSHR